MMLPEEVAKTKWCCIGMAHKSGQQRCIASACMAWRQSGHEVGIVKATGESCLVGATYQRGDVEWRPDGRGYCGLVGRPE